MNETTDARDLLPGDGSTESDDSPQEVLGNEYA